MKGALIIMAMILVASELSAAGIQAATASFTIPTSIQNIPLQPSILPGISSIAATEAYTDITPNGTWHYYPYAGVTAAAPLIRPNNGTFSVLKTKLMRYDQTFVNETLTGLNKTCTTNTLLGQKTTQCGLVPYQYNATVSQLTEDEAAGTVKMMAMETPNFQSGSFSDPTNVGACGTINAAGSYVLTNSISYASPGSGQACILISANNVDLNLAGYTMTNTGTDGNDYGIELTGTNETVHNGTVQKNYADVVSVLGYNVTITNMTVHVLDGSYGMSCVGSGAPNPTGGNNCSIINSIGDTSVGATGSGTVIFLFDSWSSVAYNDNITSTAGLTLSSGLLFTVGSNYNEIVHDIRTSSGTYASALSEYDNNATYYNMLFNGSGNNGYGAVVYLDNSFTNYNPTIDTFANSTFYTLNTGTPLDIVASSTVLFVNNTLISGNQAADLVTEASISTPNAFFWNNFTNTSGYYVNEDGSSNGNFYNGSLFGIPEGNIYYDVQTGVVQITGTVHSAGFPSLYIGTAGGGYPYSSSTTTHVTPHVIDYAPLTANLFVPSAGNLTVNYTAGGTAIGNNTSSFIIPSTLPINATPSAGFFFVNWTTNCTGTFASSTAANTTITITTGGHCYAQANFMNFTCVKQCVSLNIPNSVYALCSNVSINDADCFDVSATNITLNGNNYNITGNNGAGVNAGVYDTASFFTIYNTSISNFNGYGIWLTGAPNSLLYSLNVNTTAGASPYARFIQTSANATIVNSTFYSLQNFALITSTTDNLTIANINGTSDGGNCFETLSATNSRLSNINCTAHGGAGISLLSGNNESLTNSWSYSPSGSSSSRGITFTGGGYTVSNSHFQSNFSQAMLATAMVNSVVSNNTFNSFSGIVILFTTGQNSHNNTFINNTLISGNQSGVLLQLGSATNNNTFYWNNFTNTSGAYINDTRNNLLFPAINVFNGSKYGINEGNIYFNVINGSVPITGTNPSTGFPWLYVGTAGAGFPYNKANSNSKVFNMTDYAPLTPNQAVGNLTVNYTLGGTAIGNNSTFVPPTNLSINATVSFGYYFQNWSVTNGNCSVNNTTNINTAIQVLNTSWCNAQANFGKLGNLTVNYTIGGSAVGNNSTFIPPANLTINATANDGYYFYNWTTNCSGNIANASNSNTTIQVNDANACFVKAVFYLVQIPGQGGTVFSGGCNPPNIIVSGACVPQENLSNITFLPNSVISTPTCSASLDTFDFTFGWLDCWLKTFSVILFNAAWVVLFMLFVSLAVWLLQKKKELDYSVAAFSAIVVALLMFFYSTYVFYFDVVIAVGQVAFNEIFGLGIGGLWSAGSDLVNSFAVTAERGVAGIQ